VPIPPEPANRSTTLDPKKWLSILQRWHPRMPREELVDFINEFIEAAGPQRVEGLDDLFVHVDKTTRSAQEKLDKLRQWIKKMRSNPRFWPQLYERHRPVSVLIKKIVDKSPRPVTRRDVERKFRKYRKVPSTGLSQELRELANRGEIDRLAQGLYWRRGTASVAYESDLQRMYRLVYRAPDHRMREAELAVALGLRRGDAGSLVSLLRKRGLFAPATGNGVVVASGESLATLQRRPIFDGRGKVFFTAQEGVAPVDGAVFTALRRERLPLSGAGHSATLTATERRLVAEKECEQLLIERYGAYVRNGRKREERPTKDKIRTEMTELIPKLSGRSFDKCWKATAVAKSWDWTLPGQR
jgi:hypothetical protein